MMELFPKINNAFQPLSFLFKKAPSQMFDQVLNAPLILSTPPSSFCVRIINTFRFLFFATAFYALVITSFSLYPLSCLLNSNGYCFTFSHNIPSYFKVSVDSCQYLFLYFIFTCKNVAAKAHVWSHLQFSFKFSSYFMK